MENTNRQRNIFAQYIQNTKYFDLNLKYIIIFQQCRRKWFNSAPDMCTKDTAAHILNDISLFRVKIHYICADALRKVEVSAMFE